VTPFSWIAVSAGAASLAGLLWAEAADRPAARAIFKTSCSAGFLALALTFGLSTPFARWVFVALVLSAAGDVALLSEAKRFFLAGLGSFLAAHVAYCVAFAPGSAPSAWAAVALLLAGAGVVRWLWPGLGSMRIPVLAYCAVITVMLWLALGTERSEVRLGAALFYLSDLAVARQKFVAADVRNRLVGLPIYYAAQYLLAWAAGAGVGTP